MTDRLKGKVAVVLGAGCIEEAWGNGNATAVNFAREGAAIVSVDKGQGSLLMLGFRAQHRAQTHGTFKFFFNALMSRPSVSAEIAAGGAD